MSLKDEIDFWKKQTKDYDKLLDDNPYKKFLIGRRINIFAEACNPDKGDMILDVGCGSGDFAVELEKRGLLVVGLDVSSERIKVAKNRAKKSLFVVGCMEKMPFKLHIFEAVFGSDILHHAQDATLAISECGRVKKKDALIVFIEPNGLNPYIFLSYYLRLGMKTPDEQPLYPWKLRKIIKSTDLRPIDLRYFNLLLARTPKFLSPFVLKLEKVILKTPLSFLGGSIIVTIQ